MKYFADSIDRQAFLYSIFQSMKLFTEHGHFFFNISLTKKDCAAKIQGDF